MRWWGFGDADVVALLDGAPGGGGAVEFLDGPFLGGLAFAFGGGVPCGDDARVGLDGEAIGELRCGGAFRFAGCEVFLDGGFESGVHAGREFLAIRCEAVSHGVVGIATLLGKPAAVFADGFEEIVDFFFRVHEGNVARGWERGKVFFCREQIFSVDVAEKCCLVVCMTNATNETQSVTPLEIPLSELPEGTKDFLLAASAAGKSVTEVIADNLTRAAVAAGFSPMTPNNAAA